MNQTNMFRNQLVNIFNNFIFFCQKVQTAINDYL